MGRRTHQKDEQMGIRNDEDDGGDDDDNNRRRCVQVCSRAVKAGRDRFGTGRDSGIMMTTSTTTTTTTMMMMITDDDVWMSAARL